MNLGQFVRLKDNRIARVFSATQLELLDGSRISYIEGEAATVTYSLDYAQLLNAVFDLAAAMQR